MQKKDADYRSSAVVFFFRTLPPSPFLLISPFLLFFSTRRGGGGTCIRCPPPPGIHSTNIVDRIHDTVPPSDFLDCKKRVICFGGGWAGFQIEYKSAEKASDFISSHYGDIRGRDGGLLSRHSTPKWLLVGIRMSDGRIAGRRQKEKIRK